eukprot:g8678.t1
MSLFRAGVSPELKSGLVLWFGASTIGVASLIVLGGVTRLTRSGLSMTEWSFTGERPPLRTSDWVIEFEKYKKSPEFKRVNQSISLDDFKFIYWMEYAHRMWGRCLGAIFGLPAIYFFVRKAMSPMLAKRIGLLLLMGGTQGLVGWWMVKSGLQETQDNTTIPRVSPYRLAAHLTSAFGIYSILLWTTLSLRRPQPVLLSASSVVLSASNKLRSWLIPLSCLIGLTAFSGAFVAGNDAGRSYNTFPKMNEDWVPDEYFTTELFSKSHFFENTASVQFHHRLLAMTTGLACVLTYLKSRKMELHPSTQQYIRNLAVFAVAQVGSGITALLTCVPPWIGSGHQIGALILTSLAIGAFHSLRLPSPTALGKAFSRYGANVGALGVIGAALAVTQTQ